MTEIRSVAPHDLPEVARLFQQVFRKGARRPSPQLELYLRELLFEHPWADPELTSRVAVSDGRVTGFIGTLPLRLRFGDRSVRAALSSSLMVQDPKADPLAGAKLMRSVFNGPQDLLLSESANPLAEGMWLRLGGSMMPGYSMDWFRVLRPAGFVGAVAAEGVPLAGRLGALYRAADALAAPLAGKLVRLPAAERQVSAREAGDEELIDLLLRFAAPFALRPDWDERSLRWFLRHAEAKERFGTLVRRVVLGRGGAPLGCFLYYGRPGGIAWVLQVLAEPEQTGAVLDALLASAAEAGCVGVRGRAQPILMEALLRRRCAFFHRSSTLVHSQDSEVVSAIRSGDALITGVAGEAWTRLIGGIFA